MAWLVEQERSWAEYLSLRILKVGPLPKHLAIIMDGNRRYAHQIQKEALAGHTEGFKKLTQLLCWCRDLGINEVTAYAFSIENFKRSQKEVNALMNLAAEKFEQLLEEKDQLAKHGVCIRILGKLDLLPLRIRKLAACAVLETQNNDKCFLNLAIAYTSREEMLAAIKELLYGVNLGIILKSDISEKLFESALYTIGSRPPDLLIRTSGEVRLSDFLLWQSSYSCLFFIKVLWPEMSIWHLFAAVFYYQRHYHTLAKAKEHNIQLRNNEEEEIDIELCSAKYGEKVTPNLIALCTSQRKNRLLTFMDHLTEKRLNYLKDLVKN